MFRWPGAIQRKTPTQLAAMRRAGLVVAEALEACRLAVASGVTTGDLDRIAAEVIAQAGAEPSFLGYHGFPATICTSVNDEVVHGIPGPRQLRSGDVISIDCGAIVDGWHGDAAITVGVGTIAAELQELSAVTRSALWDGICAAIVGGRLSDIGAAVEAGVRAAGDYGIVREFVGHGIGTAMHMQPAVPNFGAAGHGPRLREGMVLAIEPMILLGEEAVSVLDDDWTVVTDDGAWAAHWEHTVAITADGPWVLTAADGGAQEFADRGVASPAADR